MIEKSTAQQFDDEPSSTELLTETVQSIGKVILGKETEIRLALTCLIARGHLLIEDLPGLGKTTLSHVLAHSLGLAYQRIQFTSDLLPADILGVSVFDAEHSRFRFHPGPVFAQLVLADEVNRATPKAQSALLEAMEEYQVTTDGETHPLPSPFFVIATQNPSQQVGTFPLPESQLDRFLICLTMGYPDSDAERQLLRGRQPRDLIEDLPCLIPPQTLLEIQQQASQVKTSDALLDYLQALLAFSRQAVEFRNGLSPRAGLALLRCAQAWALMSGRNHVIPEDVQAVLPGIVRHRLQPSGKGQVLSVDDRIALMSSVAVP